MENVWSAVDNYFSRILNRPDSVLEDSLQRNNKAGS